VVQMDLVGCVEVVYHKLENSWKWHFEPLTEIDAISAQTGKPI
jgi:hypothetical protein